MRISINFRCGGGCVTCWYKKPVMEHFWIKQKNVKCMFAGALIPQESHLSSHICLHV